MPADRELHRRVHTAYRGKREADGVVRPDEGAILGLLQQWDASDAINGVAPVPFHERLLNSLRFSEAAAQSADAAQRAHYRNAAVAEATEAQLRIRAQVTGDKLQPVSHPEEIVGLAARAAELTAFAYAAADDMQHGYEMLEWAVSLERYAAVGDVPERTYVGGRRFQERHNREVEERHRRFAAQQVRRLVAFVYPHLAMPDGTAFYDPPLHQRAPIAMAAASPEAHLLVATCLLDNIHFAGPEVARMPLRNLPMHLAVHDPRITDADAVRAGERTVGYLGLRAALAVCTRPEAGVGAWSQALHVLEGAKAAGAPMRPGALDVADKATGCRLLLAIAHAAKAQGTDVGDFVALRAGVLFEVQLFPTADATRQLMASPVVDQADASGVTLRMALDQELAHFMTRTRDAATGLGVTAGELDALEAGLWRLSPEGRLEMGAHAAVANRFGEGVGRAVRIETGAHAMGRPFDTALVARGTMQFREAERISACLAIVGRSSGLDNAAVGALRRVASGWYRAAEGDFHHAGRVPEARDAAVRAAGIDAIGL